MPDPILPGRPGLYLSMLAYGLRNTGDFAVEHAAFNLDPGAGGIRRHQIGARRFLPVVDVFALLGPPFAAAMRGQTVGEEWADGL